MSTLQVAKDILNGPALPPPPGVEPNFENPPHSNALGYGLLSVMLAMGMLAITFRIYARISQVRRLGIEDG